MNIEILQEYINDFEREIIESGFKRDLDDFIGSLPASQNNIVALRDIAGNVNTAIWNFYSGDLPSELEVLLPKEQVRPFTKTTFNVKIIELIENKEIPQPEFFSQLTTILTQLQQRIQQNIAEINNIKLFIAPYISEEMERISDENTAIISIVFKEENTISSLKQFTKNLVAWNRTLPVYHQLVKSESPEDIEIVGVQNGSIDFVVNINVDVALNLVEVFKVGFHVFASYLAYKKMLKPIIESYHGNNDLIKQEVEREKLLLANIGIAIGKKITSQHQEAKKHDNAIDETAIGKKADQVTELIASHIVNGNDLKLLAMPEPVANEGDEVNDVFHREKHSLQKQSLEARKQLKDVPQEDRIKLLEMYGEVGESIEE
jgi:hypothetical protein